MRGVGSRAAAPSRMPSASLLMFSGHVRLEVDLEAGPELSKNMNIRLMGNLIVSGCGCHFSLFVSVMDW